MLKISDDNYNYVNIFRNLKQSENLVNITDIIIVTWHFLVTFWSSKMMLSSCIYFFQYNSTLSKSKYFSRDALVNKLYKTSSGGYNIFTRTNTD